MNKDQAAGSLIGLAVGDALGTTLEFHKHPSVDRSTWHTEITGGGAFGVPAGGWTDDTSMAIALSRSIINKGKFDPSDVAKEFIAWWIDGQHSWANKCIDIGNATREALTRLQREIGQGSPYQGSEDHYSSGNGGIMRLAPVVIANHNNLQRSAEQSVLQSRITHASEECCLYANLLGRVIYYGDPFINEVEPYVLPDTTPWEELKTWGYVKHTFHLAMWAARNSSSFEECLLLAANRQGDADTNAAVAGQIAGAMYGIGGMPDRWLEALLWREEITSLANEMFEIGGNVPASSEEPSRLLIAQSIANDVISFTDVTSFDMSNIIMSSSGGINGHFSLRVNDTQLPDRVSFSIDDHSKLALHFPQIHCPQGSIESYPKVQIPDRIKGFIYDLIKEFLPHIEPAKLNQPSTLAKRLQPREYAEFSSKLRQKPILRWQNNGNNY